MCRRGAQHSGGELLRVPHQKRLRRAVTQRHERARLNRLRGFVNHHRVKLFCHASERAAAAEGEGRAHHRRFV